MERTWLLFLLFPITVSIAYADYPIALNIPPTNAFDKIHTQSGSVSAVNYSMPLIVVGSGTVSISLNNATHTLTITGTGSGGGSGFTIINGLNRSSFATLANLTTTNNQTFSGKVNFTGTSKLAPINLGGLSSDPTNLKNFDMWINSGNTLMRYRASTTTITLAQLSGSIASQSFSIPTNTFTGGFVTTGLFQVTAQNFTSDAAALGSGTNHRCTWYFNTGNSTFREICNFNGVIHVLAKQ